MDIVRNPENRRSLLADNHAAISDRLIEREFNPWETIHVLEGRVSRAPTPEEYESLQSLTDQFWSCLRVGTSYQVWSLMEPALVQREILWPFPVFRDEKTVRDYIAEFGPLRYSASIAPHFPDLNGGDGPFAQRVANPDPSSGIYIDGDGGPAYAFVEMVLESDSSSNYMIVFQRYEDDVWLAIGMYFGG